MYNAIKEINAAMVTAVNFEHNGYMYIFLIEGPQTVLIERILRGLYLL